MDKRIYKAKKWIFIKDLLMYCFGLALLTAILLFFINHYIVLAIVSVITLLIIFSVFKDKKLVIIIDDEYLNIIRGHKNDNYTIKNCSFKAKISDYSLDLYVYDKDGYKHSYDLSLIGHRSFNELLNDLGIIGDKAEPIVISAE